MFSRKKRHRSGNIGVIVVEKIGGKMKELATMVLHIMKMRSKILSMKRKNGFPRKKPGAIHNSICMVRSVRRVTVSEKKSAVFCPMSATSFSTDAT